MDQLPNYTKSQKRKSIVTGATTETLFAPIVLRARSRLHGRLGQARYNEIPSGVHAGWEAHLLDRLMIAGAKAVDWQFQIFRTARAAFLAPGVRAIDQAVVTRDFVGQPEKRLRQLYNEFPLLEHLCETLVCHWVEAAVEFLDRFWADREMLPAWFGEASASQPLETVEPALSDPHHCGRTVARMHFSNGTTLIYKPRSLAPENHFRDLLDFVNGLGCPRPLYSARSADRGAFGWMEDVVMRPCKTWVEVESFYWRAGALLGLVFLAGGVDMHRENLIAAGEYPVLIDLETLMHPQNGEGMEDHPNAHSLLRTGFLPTKMQDGSTPRNTCALWRNDQINGDDGSLAHIPAIDECHVTATDFTNSILEGFDWIGNALLRERLIASQFADRLQMLSSCPRRRILRSTAAYGRILGDFISPRCLRLPQISPSPIRQIAKDSNLTLSDDEIASLSELDCPYIKQTEHANALVSPFLNLPTHEVFRAERRLVIEALANA